LNDERVVREGGFTSLKDLSSASANKFLGGRKEDYPK
jgi:hypothetical protein